MVRLRGTGKERSEHSKKGEYTIEIPFIIMFKIAFSVLLDYITDFQCVFVQNLEI